MICMGREGSSIIIFEYDILLVVSLLWQKYGDSTVELRGPHKRFYSTGVGWKRLMKEKSLKVQKTG